MNIGILAVDSNYPNLALMKISSYHKARGDNVEWYNPLCSYDKVYIAKVFSFTPDYGYYINADQVEKGGTGYDIKKVLLPEIDRMIPDYDLYNVDKNLAYGFLTRGCPNHCKWCVVPKKEGNIATYMDIEEIAVNGRKNIILMDNNILASDYGLQQISIEEGGKEPSPAHLKDLVDLCRQEDVRIIFIQPEFDRRNAEIIARETGTGIVPINPLSYNWEAEMLAVAQALTDHNKK